MSAAKPFKTAVTSVSGPDQGWRGGLERSHARWMEEKRVGLRCSSEMLRRDRAVRFDLIGVYCMCIPKEAHRS